MNPAMSSASILSVLARVPRERAKALICAGGSCTASISAATRVIQRAHSCPPVAQSQPGLQPARAGSARATEHDLLRCWEDGSADRLGCRTRQASHETHLYRL